VCWQQLVTAGVLTLPDGTDLPDPDAQGYLVQVRNGPSSRSYYYVAPEHSDLPAAKNMLLEIGDIISNESYGEPAPDLASLAAAYAYGIARNHPFVDGNRRTALVAARTFPLQWG